MRLNGAAIRNPSTRSSCAGATARAEVYSERELADRQARFAKEGKKLSAAVPLLGILELWERLPQRDRFERFIAQAAADPTRAPLVRSRARYLESLLLDHRGQ